MCSIDQKSFERRGLCVPAAVVTAGRVRVVGGEVGFALTVCWMYDAM